MTSIIAYIRTAKKEKDIKTKVKFQIRDNGISLNYTSEIEICPSYWEQKKQGHKNCLSISKSEKSNFDNLISTRKKLISEIFEQYRDNEGLNSTSFSQLINQAICRPTTALSPVPLIEIQTSQPASIISPTTLLDAFNFCMTNNDTSFKRKQTYSVVRYSVEKYIYYMKHKNRDYILTLENTSIETLWDLENFFRNEKDLNLISKDIRAVFPRYLGPSNRAENTVISFLRIIRAVFNFCIKHELTTNYPFRKFRMKEQLFGTPIFPSKEEVMCLYNFEFSSKTRSNQRFVYIFQCMTGLRINDLYNITRQNIIESCLEYIPRKTRKLRIGTISVPLNQVALDIIKRFEGNSTLFPLISEQKYNKCLKEIFTEAGITRKITILDPKTRREKKCGLNEIVHSHTARKYFCATLFSMAKDQSIVCELSGHASRSIAFERYRHITREMKDELTRNLI